MKQEVNFEHTKCLAQPEVEMLERLHAEQDDLGGIPALFKCFFLSLVVYSDSEKLGTC